MFRNASTPKQIVIAAFLCACAVNPWGRGVSAITYKAPTLIEFATQAAGTSQSSTRLTATVTSPAPSMPKVTGAVEFFSGDQSLGVAAVADNGTATGCNLVVTLAPGVHVLTARYGGDETFAENASVPVVVAVGGVR